MNISAVSPVSLPTPIPSPEEMIAIAAARPAALQLQQVALGALHSGTTGQGTPGIDPNGGIDIYA
jgi:hypothetical protein